MTRYVQLETLGDGNCAVNATALNLIYLVTKHEDKFLRDAFVARKRAFQALLLGIVRQLTEAECRTIWDKGQRKEQSSRQISSRALLTAFLSDTDKELPSSALMIVLFKKIIALYRTEDERDHKGTGLAKLQKLMGAVLRRQMVEADSRTLCPKGEEHDEKIHKRSPEYLSKAK